MSLGLAVWTVWRHWIGYKDWGLFSLQWQLVYRSMLTQSLSQRLGFTDTRPQLQSKVCMKFGKEIDTAAKNSTFSTNNPARYVPQPHTCLNTSQHSHTDRNFRLTCAVLPETVLPNWAVFYTTGLLFIWLGKSPPTIITVVRGDLW